MATLTPQEKDKAKAGFILLAMLAGGLLYFQFWHLQDMLKAFKKEQTAVEKTTTDLQKRIKEMDALARNMDAVREKARILEQVAQKLPATKDPQGFFQALKPMLETTKMEYTELRPRPAVSRSTFTEIPYGIVARARYHEFGQFLNLIEENPNRFMRVKTFTITNSPERPSLHPVEVDIASFMFNQKG